MLKNWVSCEQTSCITLAYMYKIYKINPGTFVRTGLYKY